MYEDRALEEACLQEALACVDRELAHIDGRFRAGVGAGDENAEESVRKLLERRYRQLLLVRGGPYFARIDFTPGGGPEEVCYLGKTTVTDEERNLKVIDWRAPVASLYYEYRLGPAAYESPARRVTGQLSCKRQYTIREGVLQAYEDIDITSDDELLRPYLTVSADARLKNIISTIQAEQNAIIRAPIARPIIVQGAAGSGKTTVALHRVAWMVYTFAKRFAPSDFLILAPNAFFLNYISQVLPDLGVEDVPQMTFEALAAELTRTKFTVDDPIRALERVMESGGDTSEAGRAAYLCSPRCRDELDRFLGELEETYIPDEPLRLNGLIALTAGTLKEMFRDRPSLSVRERLAWMKERIVLLLRDGPGAREAARAYVGALPKLKALDVYRRFAAAGPAGECPGNRMRAEDVAPFLHVWLRLNGPTREMKRVRHVVLDEAQDAGLFQLSLLRALYPNATFTLLGDLAQGLFSYRGLEDWEAVSQAVWGGEAQVLTLRKSYRTTVEIMDFAAGVLGELPGVPRGEAVVRHGESPAVFPVVSEAERAWVIAERVRRRLAEGRRSVAVITRTRARAEALAKPLVRAGLENLKEITGRERSYEGGVSLLPAALAKGLEFDAVVLADGGAYGLSPLDRKLKYVACTRAMHTLDVVE
jgi:DNA helicase-2/ATP-dependent DNA helicase PcrA